MTDGFDAAVGAKTPAAAPIFPAAGAAGDDYAANAMYRYNP
jgi:hypothetical protein